MTVTLHRKPSVAPRPPDLVGALLECHERIRRLAALAVDLGRRTDVAPDDVADAAARVYRYFTRALPLHVRDEEDSIVPRLRGRSAAIDAALERMCAEHRAHRERLGRVTALTETLAREPGRIGELRGELGRVAADLRADFDAHLALEEGVLFPAIADLPPAVRDTIRAEIRARRQVLDGAGDAG
jgi:iron-sulfur cluster repair protein YtfE (RIC family)